MSPTEAKPIKSINYIKSSIFLGLCFCLFVLTGIPGWEVTLAGTGFGSMLAQAETQPKQKPTRPKTFTGTIVRDGDQYALRVSSGGVYVLDDFDRARPFEGKAVNVTGQLESETKLIHVFWIEADWA